MLVLPSGNGILEENFAEQVLSPRILHPWKRDCEYKYNLDIDLGMGNWISSGKNDELLFSKENKPTSTREKAVTSLLKKKNASLAQPQVTYLRRNCCLQSPVTVCSSC